MRRDWHTPGRFYGNYKAKHDHFYVSFFGVFVDGIELCITLVHVSNVNLWETYITSFGNYVDINQFYHFLHHYVLLFTKVD